MFVVRPTPSLTDEERARLDRLALVVDDVGALGGPLLREAVQRFTTAMRADAAPRGEDAVVVALALAERASPPARFRSVPSVTPPVRPPEKKRIPVPPPVVSGADGVRCAGGWKLRAPVVSPSGFLEAHLVDLADLREVLEGTVGFRGSLEVASDAVLLVLA